MGRRTNAQYDVNAIKGMLDTSESFREDRRLRRELGKARKAQRSANRAAKVAFRATN